MPPDAIDATFEEQLRILLNKFSKENGSNTPDYILAEYLIRCLDTFDLISRKKDHCLNKL